MPTSVTMTAPPKKLPPGKHLAITVATVAFMFLGKWVSGCQSRQQAHADLAAAYSVAYSRYYRLCIAPEIGGGDSYFKGTHPTPPTPPQLQRHRSQCAAALADLGKLEQQINNN